MSVISKVINLVSSNINPIKYAKRIGVNVGENCRFIGAPDWGSEPYLISIGNHTEISCDCTFITHDGSTWVFREQEKYQDVVKFGEIKIGNNCFIGAKTTILPGVTIGDNCIIGACSLVTKSIPEGEVWAGIPAHFISTVDEYAEKCLRNTPVYNKSELMKGGISKREEVKKITKVKMTDSF